MSKQQDYLNEVYNLAIALGIPEAQARLAATQSGVETGYGKHAPGNAYFGMKAGSSWKGKTQTLKTHEEENGALVAINDKFRVYDSKEASLLDWWGRLQARWPDAANAANYADAVKGLKAGKSGGYATDSKYGSKLNYANGILPPRPPLDIPSLSGMQGMAASAAPPPLPRPRPQTPEITSASFDPLPFPGRLQAPPFNPPASANTLSPNVPLNPPMPPRPSRWMEAGGEWQAGQVTPPGPVSQGATPPQAPPRPPLMPFPSLPRPGVGFGAVAGVGGMGAGAGGVVPPGPVPPRVPPAVPRQAATPPRYVPPTPTRALPPPPLPAPMPGFRSPVVVEQGAPDDSHPDTPPGVWRWGMSDMIAKSNKPPPIPQGGFDLGAMFGGLAETIGTKAQEAGQALSTTAGNAIEGTKAALGNTAQSATDLLTNELMGTVGGRTLLLNTLMGSKGTIHTNPGKYGKTFADRQEAAARRQALQEGRPYVAPGSGVRTQLSVPAPPRPPPRIQTRAERFTNLDQFGNII